VRLQTPTPFAEPRFTRLYGGARTPLSFGEPEIVWNVPDRIDPHLLQFLDGARVDEGQVANVAIWAWRIAVVIELASHGLRALATGSNVR
jgi:hypothetical protein